MLLLAMAPQYHQSLVHRRHWLSEEGRAGGPKW